MCFIPRNNGLKELAIKSFFLHLSFHTTHFVLSYPKIKNQTSDQTAPTRRQEFLECRIQFIDFRHKNFNLLSNAVKQTHPDNRLIKVKLEVLLRSIRLQIWDSGARIAHEDLERIFDQFVSIETEYSATGTGIGLYLSRKIMEAHGGTIKAHSEGRGLGSVFTIELPRKGSK
jgi:K+-sensing histidine kinase KdpD